MLKMLLMATIMCSSISLPAFAMEGLKPTDSNHGQKRSPAPTTLDEKVLGNSSLDRNTLGLVFSKLDVRDIGLARRVCKFWSDTANYLESKNNPKFLRTSTLDNIFLREGIDLVETIHAEAVRFRAHSRNEPSNSSFLAQPEGLLRLRHILSHNDQKVRYELLQHLHKYWGFLRKGRNAVTSASNNEVIRFINVCLFLENVSPPNEPAIATRIEFIRKRKIEIAQWLVDTEEKGDAFYVLRPFIEKRDQFEDYKIYRIIQSPKVKYVLEDYVGTINPKQLLANEEQEAIVRGYGGGITMIHYACKAILPISVISVAVISFVVSYKLLH